MEIYAKSPDSLATFVHQRGGDLARTFDGRDAWVMLPLTVVGEYPLSASAREGGKLDAELAFPWRIKQFFQTWTVGITTTLDGKDVYAVQGRATGHSRWATILLRQADRSADAYDPLCQLGGWTGPDADRFLGLTARWRA